MTQVNANITRFSGDTYVKTYDNTRPQPPVVLLEILTQLSGTDKPNLVVDLGAGTGLSTRVWSSHASTVIGIEPSEDMRSIAQGYSEKNVSYQEGYSHQTGLGENSVDIVTVSQALHWMEPEPTFAEISRILRPGGVFAALDCDWPPTMNWEAEEAYEKFQGQYTKWGTERGFFKDIKKWEKEGHLARIKASGRFRYVKEILVHHRETGNAERFIGLMMSQGGLGTLLKNGVSEAEVGLAEFKETIHRLLGKEERPWYFHYRVRVGIK